MTTILLALFGAIILGETVRPAVNRLGARVGRPAAMALVFGTFFAALAALVLLSLRLLVPQIVAMRSVVPQIAAYAGNALDRVPAILLRDPLGLGPAFAALGLSLAMALFWLGASTPLAAFTLTLLPASRRTEAASVFSEIGTKLAAYVGGTIVNAAVVAALSTFGLLVLRVPYAVPLGLLSGALVGVPYLGTFLAMSASFAVVAGIEGWVRGAEAAAVVVVVQTLVGTFVSPLIFKKHVDVDPLGCVIAGAVGGALFGITGIVLAVPAASVIKTLVVRVAAPAIRRRSAAAAVVAAALIVAGTLGSRSVVGAEENGDQLLAQAAHAGGVTSYTVPIHFDVHLRRPISARAGVEGLAVFTAPATAALQITKAPPPIGNFFHGTYAIDVVPQTWSSHYHVSSVSTSVDGGTRVYVLQALPLGPSGTIDRVIFHVAQADYAPLSAEWDYHDGSKIRLSFVNQHTAGLILPQTGAITVEMPGYALDADAQYRTYAFAATK